MPYGLFPEGDFNSNCKLDTLLINVIKEFRNEFCKTDVALNLASTFANFI